MAADSADLVVVGELRSANFHSAKHSAERVHERTGKTLSVEPLMEFQWSLYKERLKKDDGRLIGWRSDEGVAVFVSGQLVQSLEAFLQWANEINNEHDDLLQEELVVKETPETDYNAVAQQAYSDHIRTNKNIFVFMDVSIDEIPAGRLLFELFKGLCPKTAANFAALCTGEKGENEQEGVTLCYAESIFHRVVPNGWVQGGDICNSSGIKGMSIFGRFFEDECFAVSHDSRGVLGMANEGANTNNSQFYITLQATPWMDKHYVAFGRVIEGTEVLQRIESVSTFNERPTDRCEITKCGVFSSVA